MADNAKYVTGTDANFSEEVLNSDVPGLVDFWAAWCGPCLMIAPAIEELAAEYDGKFKVAKMDVDHNQVVPMQFGIRSIPTLLFFKNGTVVDQVIGAGSKKALSGRMDTILEAA